MRKKGLLLCFSFLLFFITDNHAIFLFSDIGFENNISFASEKGFSFYENPACMEYGKRLGALYFQKYGFSELDGNVVYFTFPFTIFSIANYFYKFQKTPYSEEEFGVAFSFPIVSNFKLGVTGKILSLSAFSEKKYAFSTDLGAKFSLKNLFFAFSLKNLDEPYLYEHLKSTVIFKTGFLFEKDSFVFKYFNQRTLAPIYQVSYCRKLNSVFSFATAVNLRSEEYKAGLEIQKSFFDLKLLYVFPKILQNYFSYEVELKW